MKLLAWMLTRMIMVRFVAILLGVTMFVLSLEVVSYSKEILALRPGDWSIIPQYMLTRFPQTLATFLPLSMLLALLLTLTELSYRNEMTALWAAGLSPVRLVIMLLPLALLAGGLNFVLSDLAIPRVAPILRGWGVGDYGQQKLKVGENDPIWMRSGGDILRAQAANANSTKLTGIIIFRRDAAGLLREQIYAAEADNIAGRWTLRDVQVFYRDNLPSSHLDTLIYSGSLKPAAAGARSGDPEELSLQDLRYFVENAGFGVRPVWVYETWRYKRVSLIFSALVMIGLCIPLATKFRKGGGMGNLFAVGVGLGFLYFVVDGISVTMGELGFVTPWLAAWFPVIGFTALAASITFNAERV